MSNRIEDIRIVVKRLTPTEADLFITVRPTSMSPTLELRGRLMGPRCLFSTTIEIAYPLRTEKVEAEGELGARVLIPEPNWWHPQAPFLYEGPLELWDGGVCIDRRKFRYGLRAVAWENDRLDWNGKPLEVRGTTVADLDGASAARLREQEYNAVLINSSVSDEAVRFADQYGLLVFQCGGTDSPVRFTNSPAWMGCIEFGS